MILPPSLLKKYLARFDELITVGEGIEQRVQTIQGKVKRGFVRENIYKEEDRHKIDEPAFYQWKVNCANLISQIVPSRHTHHKIIEIFRDLMPRIEQVNGALLISKGLRTTLKGVCLATCCWKLRPKYRLITWARLKAYL
jgi:hypothetical protein